MDPRLARSAAIIALGAALLALAISLVAHLLPWPATAYADTLTPMIGHYLVGFAAAIFALQSRRHRFAILLAAVPISFLLMQVPALFTASSIPGSRPTGTVRIYALNTWDAHPDPARLERALAALDADVLVLSEIEPAKRALIQRLAPRFAHQISCADRTECAMVLLSRLPVLAGGAERKRYDTPPIVWARIDAGSRGGGMLTIVGTHVHRPTRDPVLHRRQMRILAAMVAATPGPRLLVGDFNASPFSASFRELMTTTQLRPTTPLLPTWPMWPVPLPQLAIDHMLASAELDIVAAGRSAAVGSDHAPLYADVRAGSTADAPRVDAGRPKPP